MEQGNAVSTEGQIGILHRVDFKQLGFSKGVLVAGLIAVVAAGGVTGYLLSGMSVGGGGLSSKNLVGTTVASSNVKTAGVKDPKAFPDCAKGQLEKGGMNGEGTHHLLREGGPSQTAYLLSSAVDLNLFNGKMVEVCGNSIASEHVAWLMDVGYVTVVQ